MKKVKKEYVLAFYIDIQNLESEKIPEYMAEIKKNFDTKKLKEISSIKETFYFPVRGTGNLTRVEKLEFEVEYDEQAT